MAIKQISLGLTANPGRDPAVGSATLVNCYAEIGGEEQKSKVTVVASDGLTSWAASASTDATRAMISVNGTLYKVRGRRVYSVDAAGTELDIGGIASDAPVTMARNRRSSVQIGIVSQDGQYTVIESGVASDYSGILRGGANSICSLGGYFVFTHDDGSVSHTQEDNATSVDLLAYGLAESSADPAIRGLPKQGEIVAFGTRSIDYFSNIGGDPFAFQRNQSVSIGCAASGSCAEVDQTIMFLASDLTVRILNGYQAVRVSNHAVERAIADEPHIDDIVALTWTRDGHTFYCISGVSFSWVYDLSTQLWHQRESYGDTRWIASCVTEHNGELIVGVYNSGTLYKMPRTAYAEGSNPLVVKIVTPPVHAWPSNVIVSRLMIDVVTGVGIKDPSNPENVTPELSMRSSFDGGTTWSAERRVSMGVMGDRLKEVEFWRLGRTWKHGIVFELSCSAAVMRGFMGAYIDAEKLSA